MEQKIWYCTEDGTIYPDENAAREGYKIWLKENTGEDFDEELFHDFYKETTFAEYNKECC